MGPQDTQQDTGHETGSETGRPAQQSTVGIVLVHGAMHGAWAWERLTPCLEEAGLDWHAFDRWTGTEPLFVVSDEVENERLVRENIEQAPFDRAVVVCHSAAGVAATAACANNPKVAHIVYLAAFMPGGEVTPELEDDLVAALTTHPGGEVSIDPRKTADLYYHDCDPADAAEATRRLLPQAPGLFAQPPPSTDRVGWREAPSTYIVCTEDRAVPVAVQRRWAAQATRTVELAASHSPALSMPDRVAEIIAETVRRLDPRQ